MIYFSYLTDFSHFPLKIVTQSEQVKNGLFERGCRLFQLFFIDFQLCYFLTRTLSIDSNRGCYDRQHIHIHVLVCFTQNEEISIMKFELLSIHVKILKINKFLIKESSIREHFT